MYIIVRDFLRFCTSSVHICLHELFYYVTNWYYCGRMEGPAITVHKTQICLGLSSFLSGLFIFLFHEVLALPVNNFFDTSFCLCDFCDHSSASRFGTINHIITFKDYF